SVRDVSRGRIVISNLSINATPSRAAKAPGSTIPNGPRGGGTPTTPTSGVSGFLLRSSLVTGWPAMQVRAWASDDEGDVPLEIDPTELAAARPDLVVPILRLERLSPGVLIVLFDGVPRLVWLEEPHHGVQYGL